MKLPLDLKIKPNKKKLRIIGITILLILGSILFLLTGPQTINLVESKVTSENLREVINSESTVLSEIKTLREPKIEIVSLNIEQPKITAVAAIAFDTQTQQILYQKNIHEKLAPASTT
ncbi:MAG: hypothetical protein Q7R51_00505, partial [bacterium]|nr:hypothetical protein [bacterium]